MIRWTPVRSVSELRPGLKVWLKNASADGVSLPGPVIVTLGDRMYAWCWKHGFVEGWRIWPNVGSNKCACMDCMALGVQMGLVERLARGMSDRQFTETLRGILGPVKREQKRDRMAVRQP